MLIEIESAYGDRLIHGRPIASVRLRTAVSDILSEVGETDFVAVFCARWEYEEIPYANAKVDYIIDLDTHCVYSGK